MGDRKARSRFGRPGRAAIITWKVLLMVCAAASLACANKPAADGAEGEAAGDEGKKEMAVVTFAMTSTAFETGNAIPVKYTCDGEDVSPDLRWKGVPEETRSLALIVDDPDAPDPAAPKMRWVHWVLYNLPPRDGGMAEGVSREALPAGTLEGKNDWKRTGYGGPCPPVGRHRYFFRLYALDKVLEPLEQPDREALEKAMEGHVIAVAELVGTYQRP